MNEQNNQESAFMKSMRQTDYYSEWVDITELGITEHSVGELSAEEINQYNLNDGRIKIDSGTRIQTTDKTFFSLTVRIDQIFDGRDIDFTRDLGILLVFLNRTERDLVSISVNPRGESGCHNVYFLRLVFPVTE